MRRLLLLMTTVALVAAGGGAGASTKRVSITDSALSPSAVVIALGDSVRWTNKGARQHRVKSEQGTFAPFTLQPGKGKTVKFDRRGCERYEVDDRLNGRVLVGVSSCPSGTSPPPAGGGGGGGGGNTPPPKGGEATHRYNVTSAASVEEVYDTYESPLNANSIGVQKTTIRWTGTWANMRVRVFNGDNLSISGESKSSITASVSFADTRPQDRCSQSKRKTLKATASVYAGLGRDRDSSVSFGSGADYFNVSLCGRGPQTLVGVVNPARVAGGLVVEISEGSGIVHFKREGRGMFFPIDRLRDGKAFTVRVAPRTTTLDCGNGPLLCKAKLTWSASVMFNPVR